MKRRILTLAAAAVLGVPGGFTTVPNTAPAADEKRAADPATEEANKATLVALGRRAPDVDFDHRSFEDLVDYLRDETRANVFVDWRTLEAAKVARTAPVKLRLAGATFDKILTALLSQVSTDHAAVGYTIREGVIVISLAPDPVKPAPRPNHVPPPAAADRSLPEITFTGQGLTDAVDFLRDITGLKINVDWASLKRAGVDQDAPVHVRLRDVRLSTMLRYVLQSAGGERAALQYTWRDGTLLISAPAPEPAKPAK